MIRIECIICHEGRDIENMTLDDLARDGRPVTLIPDTLFAAAICPRCARESCPHCGELWIEHVAPEQIVDHHG